MNARSPESGELEKVLLGTLICAPTALDTIASTVSASDFYYPDHGRVFDLLREMREAGDEIKPQTVAERVLHHRNGEMAFGGYGPVLQLAEHAAPSPSIGYYARRVKALSTQRTAIRVVGRLLDRLKSGEVDVDVAGSELAATAEALSASAPVEENTATSLQSLMSRIADAGAGKRQVGVPMPFRSVAEFIPRMTPGQLGIIAARPSIGKTSFALQIAMESARAGHPVAVISLEMTRDELLTREISAMTCIPTEELEAGIPPNDTLRWEILDLAEREIRDLPLVIDDTGGMTVEEVVASLRTWKAKVASRYEKVPLAVIDYLGLIAPSPGRDASNPTQKIAHQTWALKTAAKSLMIPIVLLSQLNREAAKRENQRPKDTDLRDSGSIEQDANWIIGLYREGRADPMADDDTAEAIVIKNRGGRIGTAHLTWDGERTRFGDVGEMMQGGEAIFG